MLSPTATAPGPAGASANPVPPHRRTSDSDRRVQVIRLTKAGRTEFRKMAGEHELWIADIFGDLTPKDVRELMRLLARPRVRRRNPPRRGRRSASRGDLVNADVDYEVEYNNRARVPENPAIMTGWARDAQAYPEAHHGPLKEIGYGPREPPPIAFFSASATVPILSFFPPPPRHP